MKKNISIDILERYMVNKCSAEEKSLVRKWYQSLEKESDYVSELNESEELRLEEEIYDRILSRIQNGGEDIAKRKPYLKFIYMAAAVAAMLLIYIAVPFNKKEVLAPSPVAANAKGGITSSVAMIGGQQIHIIKNTTRKIYKATLPDNSSVWLSPGAEIKYPQTFDPKFRMISFSGESFFEVTKNPKRPFIINSRSIITKVWGTSFRIRDRAGARMTEVSVVTGKVSVSVRNPANKVNAELGKEEIMLYPNQNITLISGQQILKAEKEKHKASLQIWTRVNLSFDNASLKNIVPVLNAKFNVRLVVANEKLNNKVLNADFTEFNLPDILQALKKTLNVDYEIGADDSIQLK